MPENYKDFLGWNVRNCNEESCDYGFENRLAHRRCLRCCGRGWIGIGLFDSFRYYRRMLEDRYYWDDSFENFFTLRILSFLFKIIGV